MIVTDFLAVLGLEVWKDEDECYIGNVCSLCKLRYGIWYRYSLLCCALCIRRLTQARRKVKKALLVSR